MNLIPSSFYNRSALKVAQDLLGCFLIRKNGGYLSKYKIIETEAYYGLKDLASHASRGRTRRNEVMFGPPGYIYVYFTYGMHYMFNIVTGEKDYPAAVLIRAIEPISKGIFDLNTNGPARLTKSLVINKTFNGLPIFEKKYGLWVECREVELNNNQIKKTTRVGVDYAKEYKDKKWRYYIKGNKFISKK